MLEYKLLRILKEHDITLKYMDFDVKKGCIVKDKHGKLHLLIKSDLSEIEENSVAWHELGHYFFDSEVTGDYDKNTVARSRMEYKADEYMVKEMVARYVLEGNDIETTNYVDLASQIGTHNLSLVKRELLKCFKVDNSHGLTI